MRKKHIQEFVNNYLINNITKNDITVDATTGNGYDTVLLAKISKFVYGFDIQQQALDNTLSLLKENNLSNYKLINDNHENILNYLKDFKCVVFNLGYLPNSDKVITTKKETTILTLKKLTNHLKKGQFIIITCYPNHKEGQKEAPAVFNFASSLDNSFNVLQYHLINNKGQPPFVVLIEKG